MPEVTATDAVAAFSNNSSGGASPSAISVADGNKMAESNQIQYTPPKPSLGERVGEDLERPFIQAQHTIGAGMYWLGSNLKDAAPWGGLGDRITRAGLTMQERAENTLSKKFSNFTPGFMDQIVSAAPALATFAGMTLASVPASVTTATIAATAGLGIAAEDFQKLKAQGHSTAASDAFATAIGVPVGGVTALGFNTVGKLVNPWLSKVLGDTIGKIATGVAMGATGGAAQASTQGTIETATGVKPYNGLQSLNDILADTIHTAALYGVLGGAAAYPFVFKQHNALVDGFQKMGMDSKTAQQTATDVLGQTSHLVMDKVEGAINMTPSEKSRIQVNPIDKGEVRPNVLDRKGIPMDEFYPSIQESKTADQVVEESQGNEYVKLEPLNLEIKADEKLTTQDMRAKYMGSLDKQLAIGSRYLPEDMRTTSPGEGEMNAAHWNMHFDREQIQRMVDNPESVIKERMEKVHNQFNPDEPFKLNKEDLKENVAELNRHKPDLEKALLISAERDKAIFMAQRFYQESAQVGTSLGTLKNTLENYVSNRLYKPEPPQDFLKILGKGGLKQFSAHSKGRVFDDPLDAIAAGKKLATTDLADLVAVYNQEMAVVNHGRQFVDALGDMTAEPFYKSKQKGVIGGWVPQGRLPSNWEQVGSLYKDRPFNDSDGNPQISRYVFAAPKGIAKGLKPLVDPDWFRSKIPGVATVQQLQAYAKTTLLGASVFHDITFASQTAFSAGGLKTLADLPKAITDGTMSTPDWRARELKFLELNGTTSVTHEVQDIKNGLELTDNVIDKTVKAVVKAPILKQITDATNAHTKFLFGPYQRWIKVESFTKEWANWQGTHASATPEEVEVAGRQIAKATNDTFGGRNWEVLGYTKTAQSLLRTFLLAPDWATSMLGFARNLSGVEGGAAARQSWGLLGKTIAGGLAINNALNYLTTGHSTFENKKGHWTEWQSAPDVYTSVIRGMPGELTKLAADMAEDGTKGIARYAEGKASPFTSAGVEFFSGKNYYGGDIWKGDNEVTKDVNAFWNVAATAFGMPIGVSGSVDYGRREPDQNAFGWGSVLTGAGRFSRPSDVAEKQDLNQRVIQAYRNGNNEFVEHQISEGNLSEEKAEKLKEDSQLSDAELHVRRMKIDKAIDYYQKSSPEDRQNIRDLVDQKYDNFQNGDASNKEKARVKKLYESLEQQ